MYSISITWLSNLTLWLSLFLADNITNYRISHSYHFMGYKSSIVVLSRFNKRMKGCEKLAMMKRHGHKDKLREQKLNT